jgi:hypothetical protein
VLTRARVRMYAQVCEKSDGERAMLYISVKTKCAYLIDRKFVIRQLRNQPVYAELYAQRGDTLLDGELILTKGFVAAGQAAATFMTFDALWVDGQCYMEQKLSHRLGTIGSCIIKPYRTRFPPMPPAATATATTMLLTPLPALTIGAKAFHRKHHIKDGILELITSSGHNEYEYNDGKRCNKNDGIIFTPESDEYWCRRVPLLKWKWNGLNTIDFFTRAPWFDQNGKLQLYSTANALAEREGPGQRAQTIMVHVRSTQLTTAKKHFFLRDITEQERKHGGRRIDTAIVEMQYDAGTSSWQPKNFRWDKSAPNFLTTVVATMEAIIDNVTPADLQLVCARRGGEGEGEKEASN